MVDNLMADIRLDMAARAEPYREQWRQAFRQQHILVHRINLRLQGIDVDRFSNDSLLLDLYPYKASQYNKNFANAIHVGLSKPLAKRRAFLRKYSTFPFLLITQSLGYGERTCRFMMICGKNIPRQSTMICTSAFQNTYG